MSYIDDVFGPEGLLVKHVSTYKPRDGQYAMTGVVEKAYRDGGRSVVEAPMGTGKGFSYLVPAIYHAAEARRRTLVVTANKNLQAQLIREDLPTLKQVLPWSFSYALAKGRQNYVCRLFLKRNDTLIVDPVHRWVDSSQTGDIEEMQQALSAELRAKQLRLFTATSDECLGKRCVHFAPERAQDGSALPGFIPCFVQLAKARYTEADIVVTNYHLLLAHLKVQAMSAGNLGVLPPFDAIICDEAHRLADIAREFWGDRVSQRAVDALFDKAPRVLQRRGEDAMGIFFDEMRRQIEKDRWQKILDGPLKLSSWMPLRSTLEALEGFYTTAQRQEHDPRLGRYADRAHEMIERIEELLGAENQQYVYSIELNKRRDPTLVSKMIEVAEQLEETLWSKCKTVLLTSATLSLAGNFEYVTRETGIGEADAMEVGTPFDFERRCLLFVDEDMPDPTDRDERGSWERQVARRIVKLVQRNGGRALLLFTSRAMLEKAHRELVDAELGYPILVQTEDGSRTKLVQEKRLQPTSVLLGLDSFWAGINLIGECCTLVVIDRIPFPQPEQPVMVALRAIYGRECFAKQYVPRAAVQFKQGFGRLIRSETDYGVVVCLDPRLVTRPYGRTLLRSLPVGLPITTDLDELYARLHENRQTAEAT